jgi:hypothetical protein
MTMSEVPYSSCAMCFNVAQSYNYISLYILQNCHMEHLHETWDVEVLSASQYTVSDVGYILNVPQDCYVFYHH